MTDACMGCGGDLDAPEHELTETECMDRWMAREKAKQATRDAERPRFSTLQGSSSLEGFLASMRTAQDARAASPHSCPACGEKLLKPSDDCVSCEQEAARRREAELKAKERLRDALSSVPTRFHGAQFDSPELATWVRDRRALEAARKAVGSNWIVLHGNSGVGKTVLAVCLLRARLESGANKILFVKARSLALARQQGGLGDGEPALVKQAMRSDFLVLDDLGQDATVATSAIGDVIDERHENGKPTVITTGLTVPQGQTVSQIEARYNAGIARRLFEAPAVVIQVGAVAPSSQQAQPLRAVPQARR